MSHSEAIMTINYIWGICSSHLIGCIYINAIFDMIQGLVQVTRTSCPEKTVASICLQVKRIEGTRGG